MAPTSTFGASVAQVLVPPPPSELNVQNAIIAAQHVSGPGAEPRVAPEAYTERLGGVQTPPKIAALKDVDSTNPNHHVRNLLSLEGGAIIGESKSGLDKAPFFPPPLPLTSGTCQSSLCEPLD